MLVTKVSVNMILFKPFTSTEGINVNSQDDELNAKLYHNRATAHFYAGRVFLFSCKN